MTDRPHPGTGPGDGSGSSANPLSPGSDSGALERFLRGIAEYVFQARLGVVDVELIDYVGDLLLRFVRSDGLYTVRRRDGRPLTEVAAMLGEAHRREGTARREVHRHIGDFTLFWSGMYPEALRRQRTEDSVDAFLDYTRQGKLAYGIASTIRGGRTQPRAELLEHLSEEFEMCAYGMREIRRQWEENADEGGGLLLN